MSWTYPHFDYFVVASNKSHSTEIDVNLGSA